MPRSARLPGTLHSESLHDPFQLIDFGRLTGTSVGRLRLRIHWDRGQQTLKLQKLCKVLHSITWNRIGPGKRCRNRRIALQNRCQVLFKTAQAGESRETFQVSKDRSNQSKARPKSRPAGMEKGKGTFIAFKNVPTRGYSVKVHLVIGDFRRRERNAEAGQRKSVRRKGGQAIPAEDVNRFHDRGFAPGRYHGIEADSFTDRDPTRKSRARFRIGTGASSLGTSGFSASRILSADS